MRACEGHVGLACRAWLAAGSGGHGSALPCLALAAAANRYLPALQCNRPGCTTCGPCISGPSTGCRQGQQCWSCKDGWFRLGYDCLQKCPAGQFYSLEDNKCRPVRAQGWAGSRCQPVVLCVAGSGAHARLCSASGQRYTGRGGPASAPHDQGVPCAPSRSRPAAALRMHPRPLLPGRGLAHAACSLSHRCLPRCLRAVLAARLRHLPALYPAN